MLSSYLTNVNELHCSLMPGGALCEPCLVALAALSSTERTERTENGTEAQQRYL